MAFGGSTALVSGDDRSSQSDSPQAPAYRVAATQSNDGIATHGVMKGFPPPPDKPRQRWANFHLSESGRTQVIPRGLDGVTILPRRPMDIDNVQVTDSKGNSLRIKDYLRQTKTDAFLIVKDGYIVNEQYFYGMRPNTAHAIFSVYKSIYATTLATLVERGELELSKPIEHYVPELKGKAYEGATIRQLLDMLSGIRFSLDFTNPQSELSRFGRAGNAEYGEEDATVGIRDYLLTLDKIRPHGKLIAYKESDPSVLVWAAERATGRRFADLISERVWSKLGAENDAAVTCDALGFPINMMSATLRDMARWGLMCLGHGGFNGRQILRASFFRDIRENTNVDRIAESLRRRGTDEEFVLPDLLKGTGYRSYFWLSAALDGSYAALGHLGQICLISPKDRIVIVRFGSDHETSDEAYHAVEEITRAVAKL